MATSNSLDEFARRIRIQAAKVQPGADEAVVEASSAIAKELVESTPVDTGRAVSNWDASLGPSAATYRPAAVPGKKGSSRQASASEALSRMLEKIQGYTASGGKNGSAVHLTNAAPYINRLNDGSSSQAPAGFIELAIQRGRAAIRNLRIFK